jgi:hypothetical protein
MGYKSKHIGLVQIADGNSKLGLIPGISLVPGRDCGNCSHCIKKCYALKSYRQYENTRNAWQGNSLAARNNTAEYFASVREYVQQYRPAYFRWHIAGDILDQHYLDNMMQIAREAPFTKFLCFTKMHHLDFRGRPKNLTIVLSMWPGLAKGPKKLPRAWVQDGSEHRVPADAIPCPGFCESCGMCWHLPGLGKDVVFLIH